MTKFQKTGVLALMLALPVLLWLFLEFFGQNQFDIPLYYPNGLDSLTNCNNTTAPHQVSQLSLENLQGASVDEHALSGQASIIYFLPDNCTDTCLFVLEELAKLQEVFETQPSVQILTIGSADDQAALQSLSQRYRAQPEKWQFLTGGTPAMKRCQFALPFQNMSTDQTLVLVDSNRSIRGYYTGAEPDEVDRLTVEVKILLSNVSQSK